MEADPFERVYWFFTLLNLAAVTLIFIFLTASTFGDGSFLATVSQRVRIVAVCVLAIELLIPLFVYFDVRRRPDKSDTFWIHIAAMPLLNIFGLMAYL
ncbi:hypothetical protein ABSL23_00880 (plasmid) [Halobacterium sp. NMX12-1]|uniref:Cardiolipin synthase N-terminal domain-containing protein n=1 Tax=Halobacterium sp. NMX12-1 TaxID=3166650 RepID=A0AAU8CAC1_9EURY